MLNVEYLCVLLLDTLRLYNAIYSDPVIEGKCIVGHLFVLVIVYPSSF